MDLGRLPSSIMPLIEEYAIGFRSRMDEDGLSKEVWVGDNRFKNGVYREYEGDVLRSEKKYKGGMLDGLQREWWYDGVLEREENYREGRKDGLQVLYYDGGGIEYKLMYKNGRRDGLQRMWWEDGRIGYSINYRGGRLCGLQRWWYNPEDVDGRHQLESEGNYRGGRLYGFQRRWSEDGVVEEWSVM